jgi:hypothetical protein
MVRAYLLSFLSRQRFALKEQMAERFPHCWLTWEPGAWSVPPAGDSATTGQPTELPADRPAQGDALCFELQPRADGSPLKLGRAAGSDVLVNDATVSREHILLSRSGDGWAAEVVSRARSTFLGTAPLSPGQKVALGDRQKLRIGDVVLTFHEPASLLARLSKVSSASR